MHREGMWAAAGRRGLLVSGLVWAAMPAPARAEPPRPVETRPRSAEVILDGRSMECVVRFDRPVDHERSRLFILAAGQVVAELRPRLDSAPEVLFAEAPRLSPGAYELRWVVRAPRGDEVGEGTVPFRIGG